MGLFVTLKVILRANGTIPLQASRYRTKTDGSELQAAGAKTHKSERVWVGA